MILPGRVTLIEVGPRDGFQSEKKLIPTELKVALIEELAGSGLMEIQVCSFVHPVRVPQMADAEEVVARLARREGVTYSGLVLNGKGVDRAAAAGLDAVDLSISTSDTHSRNNANRSLAEARADVVLMIRAAKARGLRTRVGLQCAFGCNYEGSVPVDRVAEMSREIVGEGADALSLADSTGTANPRQIGEVLERILPVAGAVPVVLHLHDTRGLGLSNLLAALQAGVTRFDTGFGGLGGCPFIPGASGNIATEDTVNMLESMGIATGVMLGPVIRAVRRIEEFLGRSLPGKLHAVCGASGSV
jgi:hydroxymethylglutaryl-CoA lyase